MTTEMKRIYLDSIRERYRKSTKKQKSVILTEFCLVTGYERKYAIRILWSHVEPRSQRSGPKRKYSHSVIPHLLYFWNAMNRCCSKKIKAALPLWLPYYREPIDESIKALLLSMSSAGFMESDTVAHCGSSLSGEFVNTLTITDLYSGWTENRAMLTKTSDQVVDQLRKVEPRLPFKMQGFASDNRSEFLNKELHSYLRKREEPIEFVRRRPYKKNDNAHVEQKNFTHVRSLFGYHRYEDPELVTMMNEIYQAYWNPLWNYFTPCMKLKNKTRIGSKIKKEYDKPKTPAQRLLEYPNLSSAQASYLKDQLRGRNPFWLKQQLDRKLKEFFDLVEKKKATSKVAS